MSGVQEDEEDGERDEGDNRGGRDREPPPRYDGLRPEATYKNWKKELKSWTMTTDIPNKKWGAKVSRRLEGSAKEAIADMEIDTITSGEGLQKILEVLDEAFAPYLEQTMPRAFEKAVYTSAREKGQSMLDYTLASVSRFNELKREAPTAPLFT